MATNYPGPYEIEYNILVLGENHKLRFNCVALSSPAPGTAMTAINLQTKAGTPATAQACADNFWAQLRPFYHTGASLTGFTLWQYPIANSFSKSFVSSGVPTNPAGLSAVVPTQGGQFTLTMRTAAGGILKATLLETSVTTLIRSTLVANAAGTTSEKIAAYLLSTAAWQIGRDDAFCIAPLYQVGGQNEAVFKMRYR